MRRIVLGLLAALLGFAEAQAARLGLVVGNDAYRSVDRLQKARNDAEAVARALKALDFTDVVVLQDADFDAMAGALSTLEAKVAPGDTVFLFFAGHGIELDNRNYLLPTDVPSPREGQDGLIRRKSFAADELIESLRGRGAGTVIAVLDACRDNPFPKAPGRRSIGGSRGLAQMTADPGVFILFSAGARQTALDRLSDADASPNSVFTRVFLDQLQQPGADLANVAVETRGKVIELARSVGHLQTPAYYDQLTSRVVLSPEPAGPEPRRDPPRSDPPPRVAVEERPAPPRAAEPAAPRLAEKEAFDLAATIGSVEAWQAFLDQFPSGAYASFARAAQAKARETLAALAAPPPAAPPPAVPSAAPPAAPDRSTWSGFLFPDSHRRALTARDLAGLGPEQLRIARNEIFARNGRFFQSADLDRYFRQFSWYRPYAWEVRLNAVEEKNVRLIERLEKGR